MLPLWSLLLSGAKGSHAMNAEAPTPDAAPETKAQVFISYSRQDIAFADRLETALKARGFEPMIDRTHIYAFEEWWKRIEALIARADTVVFVLSPDAVTSDIALKEVAFAASLNKRFAPVVCRRVANKEVPEALRKLHFILFNEAEQFDKNADRLAEALNTDIVWIRQHTEYGEAERRWSAAGRPSGLLLHSPTLEVAEHWIVSRPRNAPEPTAEIRTFLVESRRGARVAQRLRRFVMGSMVTLLVGIILGLVGWINQDYLMAQWRWYTVARPYAAAQIWPYVLNTIQEQSLKPGDNFRECAHDCPEMVVVPAGEFMMGSPPDEKGRHGNEDPQHRVFIARAFAVSRFELTFPDWDACVSVGGCLKEGRALDGGWGRGTRPVIYVSWDDAQQYATWLSRMTGKTYRLLSEAEWEYAARAGTTTTYPWGNEIGNGHANCAGCSSQDGSNGGPALVGSFSPNAFGLHDMHGNVWEWVEDCYNDSYDRAPIDGGAWRTGDCGRRVVRGGSWIYDSEYARSAMRLAQQRANRDYTLGFRVGRTLSGGGPSGITVAPDAH
jgi:formylglycine-generating enzyme required for sulfatase activity